MTIPVTLPSGVTFEVLTEGEADYIEHQSAAYEAAFSFSNPSDVADLDAIVTKEMLCWRWDTWMSRERDWDQQPIDVRHYVDASKKTSGEIRQLKKQIGIDKDTRDRTSGDGSLPEYISRLLTAAKLMGIHRSDQLDKGLELCMQLRALATVHSNSDDEERRLTRCTAADIVEWINEVFSPEMQAVDDYFQTHVQSTWVGTL